MDVFEIISIDGVFVIVVHLISPNLLEANRIKKIIREQIRFGHTRLVVNFNM